MTLRLVPAGSFLMGGVADGKKTAPRRVTITQPYYLGVFPVSVPQFRRYAEKRGTPGPGGAAPAVRASWYDAVGFCCWLSEQEGRGYRLPTQAEWERAARGGLAQQPFPWGDRPPDGLRRTAPERKTSRSRRTATGCMTSWAA
jgi:serine/threonine-protein kinase PpkA